MYYTLLHMAILTHGYTYYGRKLEGDLDSLWYEGFQVLGGAL